MLDFVIFLRNPSYIFLLLLVQLVNNATCHAASEPPFVVSRCVSPLVNDALDQVRFNRTLTLILNAQDGAPALVSTSDLAKALSRILVMGENLIPHLSGTERQVFITRTIQHPLADDRVVANAARLTLRHMNIGNDLQQNLPQILLPFVTHPKAGPNTADILLYDISSSSFWVKPILLKITQIITQSIWPTGVGTNAIAKMVSLASENDAVPLASIAIKSPDFTRATALHLLNAALARFSTDGPQIMRLTLNRLNNGPAMAEPRNFNETYLLPRFIEEISGYLTAPHQIEHFDFIFAHIEHSPTTAWLTLERTLTLLENLTQNRRLLTPLRAYGYARRLARLAQALERQVQQPSHGLQADQNNTTAFSAFQNDSSRFTAFAEALRSQVSL